MKTNTKIYKYREICVSSNSAKLARLPLVGHNINELYCYLNSHKEISKVLPHFKCPHLVSIDLMPEHPLDGNVTIEFYNNSVDVVKLALADILLRTRCVKEDLLEVLIGNDEFLCAIENEEEENIEIIKLVKTKLYEFILNLDLLEAQDVITCINILERDDFKALVYKLSNTLDKYYKYHSNCVLLLDTYENELKLDSAFHRFFTKSIRISMESDETNLSVGTAKIHPNLLSYFNVCGVTNDSLLKDRIIPTFTNYESCIQSLKNGDTILDYASLDITISCLADIRFWTKEDCKLIKSLLLGEYIREAIKIDKYMGEHIYNQITEAL